MLVHQSDIFVCLTVYMIILADRQSGKKSYFLTKTPTHENSKVEKNCPWICSWICPGSTSFPLENQDRKLSKCSWVGLG